MPDPPQFRVPTDLSSLCLPGTKEVGYTDTILDMRSKRVRAPSWAAVRAQRAPEPSEGGFRARLEPPGGLAAGSHCW